MASGWNLCVWLECIGVVSGCCFKEVYGYPHNITYLYSTCISFFCSSSIPTPLFIFTMFFRSLIFGTTLAHHVSGNNKINCIGSREVGLMV